MQTTCGVLITDGTQLLICHPTNGVRWDIPKGRQDPGEDDLTTAVRELREETGIVADPGDLEYLGTHSYKPGKQLALFGLRVETMPRESELHCASRFMWKGTEIPEMDRFAVVPYSDAMSLVNDDLCRVITPLLTP